MRILCKKSNRRCGRYVVVALALAVPFVDPRQNAYAAFDDTMFNGPIEIAPKYILGGMFLAFIAGILAVVLFARRRKAPLAQFVDAAPQKQKLGKIAPQLMIEVDDEGLSLPMSAAVGVSRAKGPVCSSRVAHVPQSPSGLPSELKARMRRAYDKIMDEAFPDGVVRSRNGQPFSIVVVEANRGAGLLACIALAYTAAQDGARVLLMDSCREEALFNHLCDEEAEVLELEDSDALCYRLAECKKVRVLPYRAKNGAASVGSKSRRRLRIEGINGNFDIVVLHSGSLWEEDTLDLMDSAAHILVAYDRRPPDTKDIAQVFGDCGIAEKISGMIQCPVRHAA